MKLRHSTNTIKQSTLYPDRSAGFLTCLALNIKAITHMYIHIIKAIKLKTAHTGVQ